MKKRDWILLAAIILLILGSFSLRELFADHHRSGVAVIESDGQIYGEYPLAQDQEIAVEYEDHINIVVIEDRTVFVREADCDNQQCVRQGRISRNGQSIICLPHRMIITLKDAEEQEYDTIAE